MTSNDFESEFKVCVRLYIKACLKLHYNAVTISYQTKLNFSTQF